MSNLLLYFFHMYFLMEIRLFLFFCYLLLKGKEKKLINRKFIAVIVCVFFLTPTQIQVGSNYFAPAIFIFFFNLIFEQDYSLRVLRPLLLSFTFTLLSFWVFRLFKRRFFWSQGYRSLLNPKHFFLLVILQTHQG